MNPLNTPTFNVADYTPEQVKLARYALNLASARSAHFHKVCVNNLPVRLTLMRAAHMLAAQGLSDDQIKWALISAAECVD